jgi:hypothetical protein
MFGNVPQGRGVTVAVDVTGNELQNFGLARGELFPEMTPFKLSYDNQNVSSERWDVKPQSFAGTVCASLKYVDMVPVFG